MARPLPRSAVFGLLVIAASGCGRRDTPATTPATPPSPATERQPTQDPRLTASSPFRNVRPDVQYVGDAACAACHQALSDSYHQHPMGRSAAVPMPGEGPERHGPAAKLPVDVPGYRLDVATAGGRVEHVVTATAPGVAGLPAYRAVADVAIGSGSRGRSYLSCQDGAVWQSPLSWYGQSGRWDVSPGMSVAENARRPVSAACLFCHVNRVEAVPGSLNRYVEPLLRGQPAIGCERCHGPGQLHVAEQVAGGLPAGVPDLSIVNPKRLSTELAQDICRQCHLQGISRQPADGREAFDFRPGLPLDEFIRVFVSHPAVAESGKSVAQFEQTEVSRCHAGSGGGLRCTSCHDPHLSPAAADKPAFYRAKCQSCHTPPAGRACVAPAGDRAAAADNCVSCHMPRGDSQNIAHVSVTDHRILRRPPGPAVGGDRRLPDGATVVVPYRPRPGPDADRDLGLALRWATAQLEDPELVRLAGQQAFGLLRRVADERPADAAVAARLAWMLKPFDRPVDRLLVARQAARAEPTAEYCLEVLADASLNANLAGPAAVTAERLVALSPSSVDHRLLLIKARIMNGDWARAEAECRRALAIQPLHPECRLYLAAMLDLLGRRPESDREAAAAIALQPDPSALAGSQRWLAGQLR